MTGDLVERLRAQAYLADRSAEDAFNEAADRIEQLEREKAVVSDLWEQQKEIALGYLADCNALGAENERLREELAAAYIKLSGSDQHASDCATSNAPAMKPGPCDCAALGEK